jgi:hypothetical protein
MTSRALLATVRVAHASAPTARAANPATVARAAAPRAARVRLRANGRGWAVRRKPTPVCARAARAVSTAASAIAISWPRSVDQSVCLDVPMDLYALLGGTKASLPDADAVMQAMVARLTKDNDEADSGFTPAALATRTLLVEYDASLLRNPKASTPVRRPRHPPSAPSVALSSSFPSPTTVQRFRARGPPASTNAGPYPPNARAGARAADWPTRLPSPIRHARSRWMLGYSHNPAAQRPP